MRENYGNGIVLDGLHESLPRGDRCLVHKPGRHLMNVDDIIRRIERHHDKALPLFELEACEARKQVFRRYDRDSLRTQDVAVRKFETGKNLRRLDRPEAVDLAQRIHRRQCRHRRQVVRDMARELEHAAIAGTAPENQGDEFLVRKRIRPLDLEFFTW